MVTRPLELSSRLRPMPRNFDVLFYVNGALIAVFFLMFGSRFVLSPGITLPVRKNVAASAIATTGVVSIKASGQVFVDRLGLINLEQLRSWLLQRGKVHPGTAFLLCADAGTPMQVLSEIHEMADQAGLEVQIAHMESLAAP